MFLLKENMKDMETNIIVIDAEDQLPPLTIAAQPVLIILLSMLHRAADHVIRRSGEDGKKVITAVIRSDKINDTLSLSIDNFPVMIENVEQKVTDGAWPDMSICTEMAQGIGGSFNTEPRKKGTTACCTLSLPVT